MSFEGLVLEGTSGTEAEGSEGSEGWGRRTGARGVGVWGGRDQKRRVEDGSEVEEMGCTSWESVHRSCGFEDDTV
jgi:hypothetical protein